MQTSLQANLDLLHTVKWVHFTGKKDSLKQKTSTTVDDIAQHIAEK